MSGRFVLVTGAAGAGRILFTGGGLRAGALVPVGMAGAARGQIVMLSGVTAGRWVL